MEREWSQCIHSFCRYIRTVTRRTTTVNNIKKPTKCVKKRKHKLRKETVRSSQGTPLTKFLVFDETEHEREKWRNKTGGEVTKKDGSNSGTGS